MRPNGVSNGLTKNVHIFIKNVRTFLKHVCGIPNSISGWGKTYILLWGPSENDLKYSPTPKWTLKPHIHP